jgi:DNA-binding NarL/FixJ family response regulator
VDGKALVIEAVRLRPDVILADISLPVLNGIEAARRIKKELPGAKIIFLTMHADLRYLRNALRTGSSGYFLKSGTGNELIAAIRKVLKGGTYISPYLAAAFDKLQERTSGRARPAGDFQDLTDRQTELLLLIASGKSNQKIAAVLDIAPRTVKFHRAQIARKLGISGTPGLTRYAISQGLVRD